MKCAPTNRISAKRSCSGMSLLELMVAGAIAMLVLTAIASISLYSARSFVAMGNYADLDQASRNALDVMSREIRQTKALNSFSPSKLVFQESSSNTLTYVYDSTARTLTRQRGGINTVLLKQCDFLNFNISQRNPSNAFTFYPATTPAVAKLIDVSWRCSREILGAKVNTESVQTAKIVIRN